MGTVSLGTYKDRARTWGKLEGRQSMNKESDDGLDRLSQLFKSVTALNALFSTISSGNVGSHDLIHRLAHKHLPPTIS